MYSPLISIIVPCYKQAHFLNDALNSVLEQTYINWECIIVNDGSPDNTDVIASDWCKRDNRFKYFFKENGGLSSARNLGLANSKGDFILFLDSDDFIAPDKLLLSVKSFLEDTSLDLVITDFNSVLGAKLVQLQPFVKLADFTFNFENILHKWDLGFSIPIHCALFKKDSVGDIRFNETLKAKEDWLFWIKFFKSDAKTLYINQPLVTYRIYEDSMTKNVLLMNKNQELVINLIKKELNATEFEIFILNRLKTYQSKYIEYSVKYSEQKNSITYRFALKLKKIISPLGLLSSVKLLLQKFTK
jgi:glycosyltransferase involved in cell wall biosynthesis